MTLIILQILFFSIGLAFLLKVCYTKWKDAEIEERKGEIETTSRQYENVVNFKKDNKDNKKKQETVDKFLKEN